MSALDQELSIESCIRPIEPQTSHLFSDSYLHVNTGILEPDSMDELTLESILNTTLEKEQELNEFDSVNTDAHYTNENGENEQVQELNLENQSITCLDNLSHFTHLHTLNLSHNPSF